MRRRKLLVVLAGLAVVVAAGAVVLWPRADRITEENFDLLRVGMTCTEVEAVLGPPGDYRAGWVENFLEIETHHMPNGRAPEDGDTSVWWGRDGAGITAYFDASGHLVLAWYDTYETKNRGVLDTLRWRAERQWHRWFPE
jgi:hypothetical protein